MGEKPECNVTTNNVFNLNEAPNAHKHSLNCTKYVRDGKNVSGAAAAIDDNAEAYRIHIEDTTEHNACSSISSFGLGIQNIVSISLN